MYRDQFVWPELYAARSARDVRGKRRDYPYLQGKLVGGSSAVNAMFAMLPQPIDLDEWADLGAIGWRFEDLQPVLKRLVGEDAADESDCGLPQGGRMPLYLSDPDEWSPFVKTLASRIVESGEAQHENLGTTFEDGVGALPKSQAEGVRVSAADAYLSPEVRTRPNLSLFVETHVTRLLFESGKISGVEIHDTRGTQKLVAPNVVICAGAFHSPAILMRSGLGPEGQLRNRGIEIVANLPGIGENLHEHPTVGIAAHLVKEARVDLESYLAPYVVQRYSSGIGELGTRDMFMSLRSHHGWHSVGAQFGGIHVALYKPASRGRVTLVNQHFQTPPKIDLNMLAAPIDRTRLLAGVRRAFWLLHRPEILSLWTQDLSLNFPSRVKRLNAWSPWNALRMKAAARVMDLSPTLRDVLIRKLMNKGLELSDIIDSDEDLSFWLEDAVYGSWHVGGTCRMGDPSSKETVVDPQGRVIGIGGLWVADASVMPTPIRSTTNLTAMLIGEKISEGVARHIYSNRVATVAPLRHKSSRKTKKDLNA